MNVTSISDFRKDTKKYFDEIINDSQELLITRSDGKTIVAIPLDTYNSIKETEYLMSNPVMADRLRKGIEEARAGKVVSKTLAELKSYE